MTAKRWIILATMATVAALLTCYAVAQQDPPPPPGAGMAPGGPGGPGAGPGGPFGAPGAMGPGRGPMPGGGGMGMRLEPVEQFAGILRQLSNLSFDSRAMGVMAVGAMKDETQRKSADVIKDLEEQLAKTKTLGIRNAIRLSLKDMYKKDKDDAKVVEQLKALIDENDKALQAQKGN